MQNDLNTFSLAIALTLVTLSMSLILSMAACHAGSEKGLRHWALGNLALTLGMLLNTSQELLQHSASQMLASGLMILGLGVIWIGVRAFKGLSQPQTSIILLTVVVMLALGYFHYIQDDGSARLLITCGALGGLCLLSARELLITTAPLQRLAYWFTGGIMLLSGAGLWLIAITNSQSPLIDLLAARTVLQQVTLLLMIVAQIGMAGGFILMTHYRTINTLQVLSEHDVLTSTLNRRSMYNQAQSLLNQARQQELAATLIMLDVDHFKRINDDFGHQTGDAMLCHLVARIRMHLRSNDLLGRYGGEEFVLLLPGLDNTEAKEVAERIRLAVSEHAEEFSDQPIMLSISLGVADTRVHGYDYTALVTAADAALYRAKALGRNRVEVCMGAGLITRDKMALRLLSQFRHNLDV